MAKTAAQSGTGTNRNVKKFLTAIRTLQRNLETAKRPSQSSSILRQIEDLNDDLLSKRGKEFRSVQKRAESLEKEAKEKTQVLQKERDTQVTEIRDRRVKEREALKAEQERQAAKARKRTSFHKKPGQFPSRGSEKNLQKLFKEIGVKARIPAGLASDFQKDFKVLDNDVIKAIRTRFGKDPKETDKLFRRLRQLKPPSIGAQARMAGSGALKAVGSGKAQLGLGLLSLVLGPLISGIRSGRRQAENIRKFNANPDIIDEQLDAEFANASLRRKLEALRAQQLQTLAQGNPEIVQQLQQIVAGSGPSELTPHETRLGGRGREKPDVSMEDLARLLATQ